MEKFPFVCLAVSIVVAGICSSLWVVLLPSDGPPLKQYYYETTDDGRIRWFDRRTGNEKLQIVSEALARNGGQLSNEQPLNLACGESSLTVTETPLVDYDGTVQCWNIVSSHNDSEACTTDSELLHEDCILMYTTDGVNNRSVMWVGGAEMITQKWPINEVSLERGVPFLSSDLPKRYGNVLDRYYLSSLGSAIYVEPTTPLHVSMHPNKEMCLFASHRNNVLVGPTFLKDTQDSLTVLSYQACVGEDSKSTHQAITMDLGFIKRPSALPDLKMIKDPIWSTWARYKRNINQSVIENFAEEILAHNFTNSQLEIDDGYETSYGDFTFDEQKFPTPKQMVNNLHNKGFRVTTWTTPFINLDSQNYARGLSKGYFIPDSASGVPAVIRWWNGRGSVVDFTNPEAADWYKSLIEGSKAQYALDSFKFDAGETSYLPKPGLEYAHTRLLNPGQYTTLYSDAAYAVGGSMMEMRSAWKMQTGSYFMRLMDKGSSWNSLRGFQTVIPSALLFGILGYPFVLPDMIGGNVYVFGIANDNKPERELFIRWIELSAFLPCMQFSISPWQYDDEVTEIARHYVNLHRTVVYDEVVAAAERYVSGELSLPVAPIWFHSSPGDKTAFAVDDQFLVGDRYLVAPIVNQGSTSRDIYLPGDSSLIWIDRMRTDCLTDANKPVDCEIGGGKWVYNYTVELHEISWWEKK